MLMIREPFVPYALEVTAIVGAIIVVLTVILGLRVTYFRSLAQHLDDKITQANDTVKNDISKEIHKGNRADVEAVINLVNSLSTFDSMHKSIQRTDRGLKRGFFLDFINIGLLVLVGILAIANTTFDPTSLAIIYMAAILIIVDIYGFVQNSYDLFQLESKLKAEKERK